MKTRLLLSNHPSITVLLICLVATVLFLNCSIKKDFEFDLVKEFNVQYGSTSYSKTDDISAIEASSDFDKYEGDLESVEIKKAAYTVTYFNGPASQTITNATLQVGDVQGSTPIDISTISNVQLSTIAAREQSLRLNSAGSQKLQSLIENDPHSARLYFNGTANESPVDFKIKFKITVKVTYKKSIL